MAYLLIILASFLSPISIFCMNEANGPSSATNLSALMQAGFSNVNRVVSPGIETFTKFAKLAAISTSSGIFASKLFSQFLNTSPEQSLGIFHTTSFATLALLGLSQFKKNRPFSSIKKFQVPLNSIQKKSVLGPLNNQIEEFVEGIKNSEIQHNNTKGVLFLLGPPSSGKTTVAEQLPLKLLSAFKEHKLNINVNFYKVPLSDLTNSYIFGTSGNVGRLIEDIKRSANNKNFNICFIDEFDGLAPKKGDGQSNEIDAALKGALQNLENCIFVVCANDDTNFSSAVKSRSHKIITAAVNPIDLSSTVLNNIFLDIAAPKNQMTLSDTLSKNQELFALALKRVLYVHNIVNLRDANDRFGRILVTYFKILSNVKSTKSDTKYHENSLFVAIESHATPQEHYTEISEKIDKDLLSKTTHALEKNGALFKAVDTNLSTAEHIACLLSASKTVDPVLTINTILKDQKPKNFVDVIDCFVKKIKLDSTSEEQTFALTLATPWKLLNIESSLNERISLLKDTEKIISKTEELGKQKIGIEQSEINAMAYATKKTVSDYPAVDSSKKSIYFQSAHTQFKKSAPTPYLFALGNIVNNGNSSGMLNLNNNNNSGKEELN